MRALMRLLVVLTIPVILIVGGVRAVTLSWFPMWEYSRSGFPADPYGMDPEERLDFAKASVRFLNLPHDLAILERLRFSDGTLAFTDRELQHMEDVKRVYDRITAWALFAAVLAVSASWVLLRRGHKADVWGAISDGALLTLLLFLGLGLLMLLSWNQFFVGLHRIFFEADSWLFQYSDTLIRLFPERLWQDAGFLVAGLVAATAFVLALLGRMLYRRLSVS